MNELHDLKASPFLLFDGNCREAMEFYHDCLGGELILTRLGDTQMKSMFPQSKHDRIINAYLKSGNIEISATDWMAAPEYLPKEGNTYAIFITAEDSSRLKLVFDKLKRGAKKQHFQDLHNMPFGLYGQFYDKYGYHWIFRSRK